MTITHSITIDLQNPSALPVLDVMQLDASSRLLQISLWSGSAEFTVNPLATASLACVKPDGTKCWYDHLPDGSEAATISGNTVSVTLAPEVLTSAGAVRAAVVISCDMAAQVSTFPFIIRVHPNPAADNAISNSYYMVTSLQELDRYLEDILSRLTILDEACAGFTEQIAALGQDLDESIRAVENSIINLGADVQTHGQLLNTLSQDAQSLWSITQDLDDGVRAVEQGLINLDGTVVEITPQELTPEDQAQARANIGITFWGAPYSSAEQAIDVSAAADGSVKLYLFATDNGYDAVVFGAGAIADFTEDSRPYEAEKITRLHIEAGITSVGDYFMYEAYNLKHLSFGDSASVTHIGAYAFGFTQISGEYDFSGLTDTTLDCAFYGCPKLEGVTFGGSISTVTTKAFHYCLALRYVNGFAEACSIEDAAFNYCVSLESVGVTPATTTLGNWVFMFTPLAAKVGDTDTNLAAAEWAAQGDLCFVQNEWTEEQLAAIQAVTGESVEMPIPESDNQSTEFYKSWKIFPVASDDSYYGIVHPASGCCGIFSLFHIYNILHPNSQYDTFYDFITRGIEPIKIEVTESLYNALANTARGLAIINGNTAVDYSVGSDISAMDLPMALDEESETWGNEGTSFWGVCKALGWSATELLFSSDTDSGASVKQTILDNLAAGKPVVMEITGAADTGHGMHAVTAIGYDADTDRLLIIDSTWGFPSDVMPMAYWCPFEALITPDAASAVWTFDFGEVVTMNSIDSKLDALLADASFRIESGTIVIEEDVLPEEGASSFKYKIPCSNGAKALDFHADSDTLTAIKATTGTMYTGGVVGNCFADVVAAAGTRRSYISIMKEVGSTGNWYLHDYAGFMHNDDGAQIGMFALMAGTYHWTAYYWND